MSYSLYQEQINRLVSVKFSQKQAEAIMKTIENSQIVLAKVEDLKNTETVLTRQIADVRREIADVRAELKQEIADVRSELREFKLDMDKLSVQQDRLSVKQDRHLLYLSCLIIGIALLNNFNTVLMFLGLK